MKSGAMVVLGASPKEDRYSNMAVRELLAGGYEVIPVHPAAREIHGVPCVPSLAEVKVKVHTLTMYVNAEISGKLIGTIIALRPEKIIFNPGTENPALAEQATQVGIEVIEACTLVMLRTGCF
jgi:predicted CoA-binding protein